MKEPFNLEPENGDFAKYIDQMNAGAIKNLKALQVAEAGKTAQLLQELDSNDQQKASLKSKAAQSVLSMTQARPSGAFETRREHEEGPQEPSKNASNVASVIARLSFFVGFSCFLSGAFMQFEPLILFGFFTIFFGMMSGAFLGKK